MPHCLIKDTRTYSFDNNLDNTKAHYPNHGLLGLPAENLNHVCAYLNPISLYTLSRTCSSLYALVKDDHIWKTAFLANFLGIAPESDDDDKKTLLLRRSELTWKQEYISRDSMLWRWERSRNSVVTHTPVVSVISATHLLASNGLLTSSLTNGIVARSNPVTGTIGRGYLSSSAAGNGLGVGNPNAEFSLDVTACSITSDGGTAKIAWGFTNGRVAAMTVSKVMDAATKSAGKLVNSLVQDHHHGAVADLIWDGRANCILSASTDGTVKMWDPKSMLCLSTWGDRRNIDVYTKVVSALPSGIFAVALLTGDIVVWTNIERDDTDIVVSNGISRKIPCPFEQPSTAGSSSPVVSGIHIHVTFASTSLLVTYQDHPHFYRVNITAESEEVIRFGDSSLGSIGCVLPSFASKPEDASFVVVGDVMGWVSIFPWTSGATSPVRKFEADTDGFGVTSLAINNMTLAVGTQNGTVNVFDSMTLRRVRPAFRALEPRRGDPLPVTSVNLSAGKDVLVASAGDSVMAWEAGHVKHPGRWGVRGRNLNGKKRAKGVTNAKGYAQIELKRTINESMAVLKYEKEARNRAMSRERKQRANFEELGLSDAEALEYVLMVSREEAQRAGNIGPSSTSQNGGRTPEGSPPQPPSFSQEMREEEELRLAIELSLRD